MKNNLISMRMSSPVSSGEELDAQLKLFIEIATNSGYTVTKKVIYDNTKGYNVVEVEGEK